MTNLTLSDFYNPTIVSITKIFIDLAFLLQVFMAPFIFYAIIKKSRNMKIYRWYLINGIVSNSLLVFCFAFVTPTLLGVYPILVVNSFFEYWFDMNSWYTIIELCLYAVVNTAAGLSISVAYRVIHLLNLTEFITLLSVVDKPVFVISFIGITQVVALGLVYLIFELRRSSALSQENYDLIATNAPFLEDIFINRRVIAFGGKDTDITVFIIILFSVALIYTATAIFFSIFPIIFLKRAKKERSPKTYELQLKLFKACLIQGWIIMILAILPACFVLLIYWIKMPNSAIFVQIFLTLASWHGPIDMFVIGYFIPSHRKFFAQLIRRIVNIIKHGNGNNVTIIPSQTAWATKVSQLK